MKENIDLNQVIIAIHCQANPLFAEQFNLPAKKAEDVLSEKVNQIHLMLKNNRRMHSIFEQLKDLSELDTTDNLELLLGFLRIRLGSEMSLTMIKRIGTFFKSDKHTAELLTQKLAY
jgi:hypothetical protein